MFSKDEILSLAFPFICRVTLPGESLSRSALYLRLIMQPERPDTDDIEYTAVVRIDRGPYLQEVHPERVEILKDTDAYVSLADEISRLA